MINKDSIIQAALKEYEKYLKQANASDPMRRDRSSAYYERKAVEHAINFALEEKDRS